MRIIHCADLHLDSGMETNLSKEQASERKQELLATFAGMIDYAGENGVKVIIIAGDLFDTANTEQKRIKSRVLDLIKSAADIDFIYLQGNHDRSDYFATVEDRPANLKMFGKEWSSFVYGNIVITGCELSKNTRSSVYDELILREADTNIVVLHGQESQYDGKNDAEIINLRKLANRYIDYLALGHIHQYKCEKLDGRGIYCYSGCLEGRGFDECGDKGFVLLDVEEGVVNHRFIAFSKRNCHEVRVDIGSCAGEKDIIDAIEEKIEYLPEKDLVKVLLTGERDADVDVEITYLKKQFENRFYLFKLYDKTQIKIDYEAYKNDISLKGEFIRLIEASDLKEEEKQKVIVMGIRALAGRELEL